MATKCNRKIPTVSIKSNYNVEGNFNIEGKLIINGEDFTKNIVSSINGKTGDVKLVAGEGIKLDLSKNKEIIISNSLVGSGIWKFEIVKGEGHILDIVENPKTETIYLVDKGAYVEAQIYDVESKTFKKLSTAEGDGDFNAIYEQINSFERKLVKYEEQFSALEQILPNLEEKLDELEDISSRLEEIEADSIKIERPNSLDSIETPSSNSIYIVPDKNGNNIGYIWNEETQTFETILGGGSGESVDLANYVTKSDLEETISDIRKEIASSGPKIEVPTDVGAGAPNYVAVEVDENTNTYTIKTTEVLEERLDDVDIKIKFVNSDIYELDKRVETLEKEGPGGVSEDVVRDIVEDVLSARITTAYATVNELNADIDNLEENKIYWVNDKGTIEQYIKQGDKIIQISGGFNIKKDSAEDDKWSMPWSVESEEIEGNLLELVDGSYLFDDYHNLRVFTGDTNNMTHAVEMFNGTKLEEFRGELSSLVTAEGMFAGCKLDLESIINIIDTIETYDDGKENHKLTIGYNPEIKDTDYGKKELENLIDEGEYKGWDIIWEEWSSWS